MVSSELIWYIYPFDAKKPDGSVEQLDVCVKQKDVCDYFQIWYHEWNGPWLYS